MDGVLEVDDLDDRRLTVPRLSSGTPGNFALSTFLGRVLVLFEAGKGKGRARGRLRSDTDDRSDSLPTPGRFDDVTELSEFLRGRVGGFVDFRRMDLTGCPSRPMGCGCCCGCCCWDTRGCNCICCSRSRTCSCLSLSGHSALDDFRLPYRSSRSARAVPVPPILGRRYCRSLSMSFMSVCV